MTLSVPLPAQEALGFGMLALLGGCIVATGLPVWALLLGVSTVFAVGGLAAGSISPAILAALPLRIVGLLDNDLLQALPLYVFVGVLLQRLAVADAIDHALERALRGAGAASARSLAALGVGLLVAPMNGSVASSASLLSRLVAPRLHGLPAARALTLVSAAATIGVVVPPSLVLILLGDAMMRAHTQASHLPGVAPGVALGAARIINTQDVFRAALLPAAAVLALWAALAWWQGRPATTAAQEQAADDPAAPLPPGEAATALVAVAVIVALLTGVFLGKVFAVEAAACGGVLLLGYALFSRALTPGQWREVLLDSLALSGALFALLVGATTFSLVFRLFGSDVLLASWVMASGLGGQATAALVLLFVALSALVLDAFEIIFVIVPIVAPALIARLGDAQQAAVLLLLVLQLSFLIPPMGYAVMMVRARSGLPAVRTAALFGALLPFMLAQLLLVVTVFFVPRLVHGLDEAAPVAAAISPADDADLTRRIENMSRPEDDTASPAASAGAP
jgi:TRAP-type mannitol/chloroaromatic compound transport system permease large subunit